MPAFCAVLCCSDKYGHAEKVPFHRFPINRKELLQPWLEFTGRAESWKPTSYSAICGRHFRDEDYNKNDRKNNLKRSALPTIRNLKVEDTSITTSTTTKTITTATNTPPERVLPVVLKLKARSKEIIERNETETETETESETESTSDSDESHDSEKQHVMLTAQLKSHCRFCSELNVAATTFANNFEVYGIIQKCLPTLNIQQDDQLPKDICGFCLKHLKYFSEFIDKVLASQNELQRKYRIEQQDKKAERLLKIKQEPVVRVKQEVPDYKHTDIPNDLDDDGCEHDAESNAIDQKFPFDDLPLLNPQDVINDCDIMEIINLDDPFINIPDDDVNTVNDMELQASAALSQRTQLQLKSCFPSPAQILTTHLLYEEHNYANILTNNLKQEWQANNYYKTEKIEAHDAQLLAEPLKPLQQQHMASDEAVNNSLQLLTAQDKLHTKPIVQVVSSLTIPTQITKSTDKPATSKPNIVVLNDEHIVKSSNSFQLHACSACQLKYFSKDSLNQHYAFAHGIAQQQQWTDTAMVVLPSQSMNEIAPCLSKESPVQFPDNLIEEAAVSNNNNTPNKNEENIELYERQSFTEATITHNDTKQHHNCPQSNAAKESSVQNSAQAVIEDGQFLMNHCDSEEPMALASNECVEYEAEQTQIDNMNDNQSEFPNMTNMLINLLENSEQLTQVLPSEVVSSSSMENTHHDKAHKQQTYVSNIDADYCSEPNYTTNTAGIACKSMYSKPNDFHYTNSIAMLSNNVYTNAPNVPLYPPKPVDAIKKQKIFINDVNILNVQHSFAQQLTQPQCQQVPELKSDVDFLETHEDLDCTADNTYETENNRSNVGYTSLTYEQWEQLHFSTAHANNFNPVKTALPKPKSIIKIHENAQNIKKLTTEYRQLKRLYLQLLQKCKHVPSKRKLKIYKKNMSKLFSTKLPTAKPLKYTCGICGKKFTSIYRLLLHKQIKNNHLISKPKYFASHCNGCGKIFQNRRALSNHQRYICLSMPLSYLSKRLHNYKCRLCGVIAFPHWRIYRSHVSKCKLKQRNKEQHKKNSSTCTTDSTGIVMSPLTTSTGVNITPIAIVSGRIKPKPYVCSTCKKEFATASSLNQHQITHTTVCKYQCHICASSFKRRHGLKQHIRNIHLELKPYKCAVCKHAYALKGDMRRCRHSNLKG